MNAATPPSESIRLEPGNLTRRQAARRRAVLNAAVELAGEGGYDAVQMRDISRRADVALGTIYHYFGSKDVLLAAAMVQWVEQLDDLIRQSPPRGQTTTERVLDLLGRITRAMRGAPDQSHAMVTAMCSRGDEFDWCQQRMHEVWSSALSAAFGDDVDTRDVAPVIRVLEHVWFSGLIAWTNEWMTLDEAADELTSAARVLLDRR